MYFDIESTIEVQNLVSINEKWKLLNFSIQTKLLSNPISDFLNIILNIMFTSNKNRNEKLTNDEIQLALFKIHSNSCSQDYS